MKEYNTTVFFKYPGQNQSSIAITNDPIVWAQAHTGQDIYAQGAADGADVFIPHHNIGHLTFEVTEDESTPPEDVFCGNGVVEKKPDKPVEP